MAYNLARNSRVFVTTNLNTSTGAVLTTGLTTSNTWEIQVLDGFSFSQATNNQTIAINEAGDTPIRGQRAFNTALNPAEISFSTYIRPRLNSNQATAEERILWNALLGNVAIDGTSGVTAVAVSGATGITRASTATATATIAGTAMTYPGIVANNIITVKGITGTGASAWNQPAKVVSLSATAIVIQYLTAPPAASGTTLAGGTYTGLKFDRAAWVENPTGTGIATSYSQVTSAPSNRNQLQSIGFIFIVDGTTYTIDNCAMDQASIDFGLDAIAMVAWNAKGTRLNQLSTAVALDASSNPVFSGGMTGTATGKVTTANYITNKLSTVTLQSNLGGIGGTAYSVVLTGGNFTISNNINYVTPNNIGTLNLPIGYYTGARAVSGSMNAYLRTGSGNQTATLLQDILTASASATDTKYRLQMEIGGAANGTRVELEMPGAMIGIPSVDIADVVSTAITFNAQSTAQDISTNLYDIENTNDIAVRYYSL